MKKYSKLLEEAYREGTSEKARIDPANNWAFAHIPTKLARKKKPSTMSLRKHRRSGHPPSGSHNPKIKENRKRETESHDAPGALDKTRWKSSIMELFSE